jgi:bifunctional lysine-specific demethylase and histidyl-hydroxylase MINA
VTTAARTPSGARAEHDAAADALALTLDPVSQASFFDEHWERRPLVIPRKESGRFAGLLSLAEVERLVCETGLRIPAFRLVKDGLPLPPSDYTEDIPWRPGSFSQIASVECLAAEFAAGATLVLQALHLWRPEVALYCRGLEMRLGFPVQANAYLTPAAAQGFAVHHDTHNVFVLQVAGRKRWRLYEPRLELPLKDQRWSQDLGEVGPPIDDFTLEAGDTLYVPRGWPHEAETSHEEALHLTIGLHPPTRMEALRAALESCADDVEFRRSLGPDGDLPDHMVERLAARLRPGEIARRARRRFVAGRRPILHDQLSQLRGLGRVSIDSPLERRPTVIFELEQDPTGVVLLFEGKEMRLPGKAAAAVEAVAEAAGPFSAADLPGALDEHGRLVLVRRLVREGFVRALDQQAR